MNEELKVTSIEELKSYSTDGSIVSLPPFGEGKPFVARLRRPSMLALARSGKIPNPLLQSAANLFEGGAQRALRGAPGVGMEELLQLLDIMCDAAFVEPTFKQLKDAGIQLTDDQYIAVFNYAQIGVKSLENFRSK